MRYAIISDVHGNLEALEAVVADIRQQGVDKVICLGDLVGYYPNPADCLQVIRSWPVQCIGGNHDRAVAGHARLEDFNPAARDALAWTYRHLAEEDRKWLAALPGEMVVDGCFLVVHGAPGYPDAYIFTAADAEPVFDLLVENYSPVKICFYGHTHQRAVWSRPAGAAVAAGTLYLEPEGTYLINPGSVGQSRDGIPGASYLIFDAGANCLIFRHLDYPYQITQQKVLDAGLPSLLAERLAVGV